MLDSRTVTGIEIMVKGHQTNDPNQCGKDYASWKYEELKSPKERGHKY